ncbi:acyl transferase/acyl hydrolase/lysophospholipase [Rhizophagus diaphanus]|nr:acyl transferase/acyl hydrolase/lysophospholipase [Rhizophagus diaphanus] [Rhizophagus sp. MUCL 43196]
MDASKLIRRLSVSGRGGKKTTFILSIDGGGIRGLIPSIILDRLEKVISEKRGVETRIAEIFDMVAGTSTGSIIALGLTVSEEDNNSKPKYPASTLVDIYEKEKDKIFDRIFYPLRLFYPRFKPGKFERLLNDYFTRKNNEVCKLSEHIVKGVHVLVPSYNITSKEHVFFNNYSDKFRTTRDYTKFTIPDVIRASTAAPTYFPAKKINGEHYIDGGVFMNNPSYFAYRDAKRILKAEEYVICSLGTGHYQEELGQLINGGLGNWALPIISLTMNSSSKLAEEYFHDDNKDKDPNKLVYDFRYYPLRPSLKRDTPLDDTGEESMKSLREEAEKCINDKVFNELVQRILEDKFDIKD